MTLTEDGVWAHLVADLKRPNEVTKDGQGGITRETYERLEQSVIVEFTARCTLARVPESLRDHPLLKDAMELQLAARILRRLRAYQEVADSLFADANIKWRLFLEAIAKTDESGAHPELIEITEGGHEALRQPWLTEPNALVDGFTKHPERE